MAKKILKEVTFTKSEIITKSITENQIGNFDIYIDTSKFGPALIDLGMAIGNGEDLKSRDMVDFIVEALDGWSLKAELTEKNVSCIRPHSLIIKMFESVIKEANKIKN